MSPKEQELMERYIYQVVHRLPKTQKNEVGMELQELIGDMFEAENSMEAVLMKLGNPAEFAKKYQDKPRYLIGPEYFDTYQWFVKIILICSLISIVVVSVVGAVREGVFGAHADMTDFIVLLAKSIADMITNGIVSCISAFGGVTLVFAIMERQKVKLDIKQEKEWSVNELGDNFVSGKGVWTPKKLAPIPHKKAIISRSDSIVGIVFITIFCILLVFAPQVFSAGFKENETYVIVPLFNLEEWNVIIPIFVLSILIGLADEIFRLVTGCYCKAVMISNIVSGLTQIVLCTVVFKVFPLWNPNFAEQIQAHLNGKEVFAAKWNAGLQSNIILTGIIIITIIEITVTVYKTMRYGTDTRSII